MKPGQEKELILLLILLVVFGGTGIMALVNPSFHILEIGLPNNLENALVVFLSIASLGLVVWDLARIRKA